MPKTRAVMVRQRGAEPVPLGDLRRTISWRELRQKVAAALDIEVVPGTRLVCECGRTNSNESAARRRLPRRCCDTEELVLTLCERRHEVRARCPLVFYSTDDVVIISEMMKIACG